MRIIGIPLNQQGLVFSTRVKQALELKARLQEQGSRQPGGCSHDDTQKKSPGD